MSSLSNISNILSDSILLNNQQSSSNHSTNIPTTNPQAQTSGSNLMDTVSLTSQIMEMENQALINAESNFITGSDNSSDNILRGEQGADNSSTVLSDLFLSEENVQLMQANPTLVKNIIAAEQAQLTDSASSSSPTQSPASGLQVLQAIGNINLLSMNPETLIALQQKYTESANSNSKTASSLQVNKTV
jgi:hypothetical protein